MSSTKTQPIYRGPLISELEQAVRSGSQETRVRTLRRITDLFLGTKERLSEEQIEVFDEVLSHLIARMESTAHRTTSSTHWRSTTRSQSQGPFLRYPIA